MSRPSRPWSALALATALVLCVAAAGLAATLHQVGTMEALSAGDLAGRESLASLARQGDFGLGTFENLDGELVALDGRFYQIRSDGVVRVAPPGLTSPFAQVVFFKGAVDLGRVDGLDLAGLTASLARQLPDPSKMYAVRVDGLFTRLTLRSPRAQARPWPTLVEALRTQAVFPLEQAAGSMVGIYTPPDMAKLSSPGWHFHFLSNDRRQGGHVLAATVAAAKARGDAVTAMTLLFPDNPLPRPQAAKPAPGQE